MINRFFSSAAKGGKIAQFSKYFGQIFKDFNFLLVLTKVSQHLGMRSYVILILG